jgi:hypothetical protein
MEDLSRRQFLTRASAGVAASVAAASGLSAVSGLVGPALAEAAEPEADLSGVGHPVVAYVTDGSAGEVTVLVGTQEIVTRDGQLAARMLRAARGAKKEG